MLTIIKTKKNNVQLARQQLKLLTTVSRSIRKTMPKKNELISITNKISNNNKQVKNVKNHTSKNLSSNIIIKYLQPQSNIIIDNNKQI